MLTERIQPLPNNSYLVQTAAGQVLVNCPPETLKYILAQGLDTPQIILLPPDMPPAQELGSSGFVHQGINYASVEFLLYANFFGKNRPTCLIAPTTHQASRLDAILEETFTGPREAEYYGPYQWLKAECEAVGYSPALGRAPTHRDLCQIKSLETHGGYLGHDVHVRLEDEAFVFYEATELIAYVSTQIKKPPRPLALAPARPLLRHELTLQFIGGSDGFDPAGITTCFLAYLGNDVQTQATLFDTAAYLRLRLNNLGLSTRQISEVVISHLHEDHLAGLPELLLMGDHRIRLLTSDVIHQSLLRVLSAMLDITLEDVSALFEYHPLNPGQPVELEGRRFESIYAIHTIPTIAVRANGLYYSGDMRYDEQWFGELVEQGILTAERRERLITFAEGAKVLVQDAGGGAIHTTITPALLEALTAKSQRVILAHTSQDQLSAEQANWAGQIEFASSGHVSSIGDQLSEAANVEIIESIEANPLLARLSLDEITRLAEEVELFDVEDGQVIIHEGDSPDGHIYIIHSGLLELRQGTEEELVNTLGRGHAVGIRGVLEGWYHAKTIVAHGAGQLLRLPPETFRRLIDRFGLEYTFHRTEWLWRQAIFKDLPWSTMLDLALDFEPRLLSAGESLFTIGELADEIYLLISGRIKILDRQQQLIAILDEPSTFFGGRGVLYENVRNASARAAQDTEVWALPLPALKRLQMVYPHMAMHLRAVEGARMG